MLCRDEARVVVITGTVEVELGDQRLRLEAGDQAVLPTAAPRCLRVVADARVVAIIVPAGLERLVEPLTAPPLPDPDDLAAHLAAAAVTLLPGGRDARPSEIRAP